MCKYSNPLTVGFDPTVLLETKRSKGKEQNKREIAQMENIHPQTFLQRKR